MKRQEFFSKMESIENDLLSIQATCNQILVAVNQKAGLPRPADNINPMGKGKCFSKKLIGGFRDPVIRKMVMDLRSQGVYFPDITQAIKNAFPDSPEKHPSKSAVHRFYQDARAGRLKEYGIKGTFSKSR